MNKILFFLFSFSFIWAHEEIEVALTTNAPIYPVYLSSVIKDHSEISPSYLDQVRNVLAHDLELSGYFGLQKVEKTKDLLLSSPNVKNAFDPRFWKDKKARFIIKLGSNGKEIFIFLYDSQNETYLKLKGISLSSDIKQDRKKIHLLSDDILYKFLGKKGIATSSVIYTLRKNNPDKGSFLPWLSEVWECDIDGYNARRLTFENNYCVCPVFLKKEGDFSTNFLYVSYKKGIPKIYIRSASKSESLISLRGNQLLPSISHQMDRLAFISDAAGRPDLFIQKLDEEKKPIGKPWQLFSAPKATQASSTFSPDGKKIAFVSDKDGTPRIYIIQIPEEMNHLRPHAQMITKKNKDNVTPAWSNDGLKLAYSANTDDKRQIWIYDFLLDEEKQITFGGENKENPCWADDNLHIVYNTEDKNISELYIINLNTLKPEKISSGEGQKRFPAWGRKGSSY